MYSRLKAKKYVSLFLAFVLIFIGIVPAGILSKTSSVYAAGPGGVLNGGFEISKPAVNQYWSGLQADSWTIYTPYGTPEYSVVQDVYKEGNSSLRISHATPARSAITQAITGVVPSGNYKVGMWVKTENISEKVVPRLQLYNSSDAKIGGLKYFQSLTGTNDWTYLELNLTLTSDTAYFKIEIFLGSGEGFNPTGTAWIDGVTTQLVSPVKGFKLEMNEANILPGQSVVLNPQFTPDYATNKNISWTSTNENVASVNNGTVTAATYGTATITAKTEDGGFTDICNVLVGNLSGVTAQNSSQTTNEGKAITGKIEAISNDGGTLTYAKYVDPSNGIFTINSDGTWIYTPKAYFYGTDSLKVAAISSNGGIGISTVDVTVIKSSSNVYDQTRQKWYNTLTGGTGYDSSDPSIASYINYIVTDAQNRWSTMDKSATRTYLWSDIAIPTASGEIVRNFSTLKNMALAYSIEGSPLYHNADLKNDIISGMDWMYTNKYNENTVFYDNWYHWQISGPMAANDVLVLMYQDMTQAEIDNYMRAIDHFVPDPTTRLNPSGVVSATEVSSNRAEKSMVVALRGVLGRNDVKITQARDALSDVFLYVTSGDGFYTDGSFVQHSYYPYAGNYGIQLLGSIAKDLSLLSNSPWEVSDPNISNVWKWIFDSYEPFIYKGSVMDLVKGRFFGTDDHASGRSAISNFLRLLDAMPEDKALITKKLIKEIVQSDTTYANYSDSTDFTITEILKLKNIMNDDSITPRGELVMSKVFPVVARALHLRPEFGFGISMFSNTISSFEAGNGQNNNGWFEGAGMTNLYNKDLTQFTNIVNTIDMKRLPGITTDGSGSGTPKQWALYPNPQKWVGGSTLNNQLGSVGMDFSMSQNTGSTLQGKKSWFMFGDKITALGAGINSTDNVNVETIVENRKLNSIGSNTLTVNGTALPTDLGWNENMTSVNWAHLTGNVTGSDIGYYFPGSPSIYGLREERKGPQSKTKIIAEADAEVRDGSYGNTNYGTGQTILVRQDGVKYDQEGYFRFDLSNVKGNIVSAKVKLYISGGYAGGATNYAEIVNNSWDESSITWNNTHDTQNGTPIYTGDVVGSWNPAMKTWVTLDVTSQANSIISSDDSKLSLKVYAKDKIGGNHYPYYATRENATSDYRPYIEVVTDTAPTERYLSLAFEHGANPVNADYSYVIMPNKTAEEMDNYASNPDITILENSTDAQAVKDYSLNAVGVNFWNDITKTVNVDGEAYITSDRAASVTTLDSDNGFDVAVSDPTKTNTDEINLEINRAAGGVISADPGITVTQLRPTIKMKINVNEANGKSFSVKFRNISNDATLTNLKYEASKNDFQTVQGFVYSQNEYTVTLPYSTDYVPQVKAETVYGSVYIKQADKLPGVAVINVIAEDGVTEQEYKVNFKLEKNNTTTGDNPINPVINENTYVNDAIKAYIEAKPEDKSKFLDNITDAVNQALLTSSTVDNNLINRTEDNNKITFTVSKDTILTVNNRINNTRQEIRKSLKDSGLDNVLSADTNEIRVKLDEIVKKELKVNISGELFRLPDANKTFIVLETNNLSVKIPATALSLDESASQVTLTIRNADGDSFITNEGLTRAGSILNLGIAAGDAAASKEVERFNDKVVVRLSYNNTGINEDKLGVYRYNPETRQWDYVGGKINKENYTIEFSTPHFSSYAVMEYNKSFTDVDNHWAKKDIELMAAKHIIKGVDDVNFAPENKLTRAEFAAMIVRGLCLDIIKYNSSFKDVSSESWYADLVQTAASKGLVKGDGMNFNPDDTITREEMTALMVRAYKLASGKTIEAADISKFSDVNQISTWARNDVEAAYGLGLIVGTDRGALNPASNATRAEAATFIRRLLERL